MGGGGGVRCAKVKKYLGACTYFSKYKISQFLCHIKQTLVVIDVISKKKGNPVELLVLVD